MHGPKLNCFSNDQISAGLILRHAEPPSSYTSSNGPKRHYFSCRKMLLSKSHHLVSILKTESQDELTTEARLDPTDVHAELNKLGT